MATFTDQSHLDMPPPGWLHVNGVSLSTDVHQQPSHTSDNRTKHVGSPVPPLMSPPNPMPFTATMIDGQNNNRQYYKLENADLPKKLFIDRQIKKAKSLSGLIKGTALSHQNSLHSAPYIDPTAPNSLTNDGHDDPLPTNIPENDNCSSSTHQNHERTNEIRRPRVSFSEFNKVQFFEDSNDALQPTRQRHRHRSPKKSTPMIANNYISPPSIQQSQTLYAPYRPLSRQQPIGHELNIKKQQLNPSPRIHSSRITHLPDILNHSIPIETSIHEKYILQREKTLFQFPEPAIEIPINSSAEISRESTRAGGMRPSAVQDYYDPSDGGINTLLNSSSISSSLTSRQRPLLRTISLRQQFMSPIKSKPINFSNNHQTITNPRRSASLKHSITRNHLTDEEQDEMHNQNLLSTYENRPMTGINSSKQFKRNYIIHFNSKNPFNGNTTIDTNETNRHYIKSNFHESSQERFQNVLKIVRPPYVTTLHNSHHDSTLQPTTTNHINGSERSSRTNSGHGSRDFHMTSNTIFV